MNLLFASDSFNDILSAHHCGDLLGSAAREIFAQISCRDLSLKSGEGSLVSLAATRHGDIRYANTHDPLGRALRVPYLMDKNLRAYVDASEIAGIFLMDESERNPLLTSSYGLGEVIRETLAKGAKEIYLSLEGAAVFDGGIGCLKALGYRFLSHGRECPGKGEDLPRLEKIDSHNRDRRLSGVRLFLLENEEIPYSQAIHSSYLAHTSEKEVRELLQKGLENYASLLLKESGKNVRKLLHATAGGVMSGTLQLLLEAEVLSCEEGLLRYVRFDEAAQEADYVITGQGSEEKGDLSEAIIAHCRRQKIPVAFLGQKKREDVLSHSVTPGNETAKELAGHYRREALRLLLKIREDLLLAR